MLTVKFTDRQYLGDFRAIDHERTLKCERTHQIDGLTYLYMRGYVIKVVETSFIKSITNA